MELETPSGSEGNKLDGNNQEMYAEEEAAGTRLLIDGKTCLLQNEHDSSKLVAETPCKLLRFLVQDGSHVDTGAPYAKVEVMKMCMPLLLPASKDQAIDYFMIGSCYSGGALQISNGPSPSIDVLECQVIFDPRTRESHGFAFVTMETVEDVERCIKYLNCSILEGHLITMEKV